MASILVVRAFDNFSRILSERGFAVINCPTIKTAPLENLSAFEERFETLADYDGIFLTSRAAAEIFCRMLRETETIYRGKVFVLGKRSLEILSDENLDLVFDETVNTAREMLERMAPADLENKRFLFVRGENSLRVVPDFLAESATVDETIVYRTGKIKLADDTIEEISEKITNNEIFCACFFSPSGAESFIEQFGADVLEQSKVAVIGKTTGDYLVKRKLKVDFVSPKTAAEDFAVELIEHLKKN